MADEEARAGGHPGRAAVDATGSACRSTGSGSAGAAGPGRYWSRTGQWASLTVRVPFIVQPVCRSAGVVRGLWPRRRGDPGTAGLFGIVSGWSGNGHGWTAARSWQPGPGSVAGWSWVYAMPPRGAVEFAARMLRADRRDVHRRGMYGVIFLSLPVPAVGHGLHAAQLVRGICPVTVRRPKFRTAKVSVAGRPGRRPSRVGPHGGWLGPRSPPWSRRRLSRPG